MHVWIASDASVACEPSSDDVFVEASSDRIKESILCASRDAGEFLGLVWGPGLTEIMPWAWARCMAVARATALVYGDYEDPGGYVVTLDPEPGSLREEFDTGPIWLARSAAVRAALDEVPQAVSSPSAIRYALWLALLRRGALRLPERIARMHARREEDLFAYVREEERTKQAELERVVTDHLHRVGAWLPPRVEPYVDEGTYPVEASVVIPVKNRVRTIADAVSSALSQRTRFHFNVIVVDNHSDDGTRMRLEEFADPRLHVVTPSRWDLGIGGCWNLAAASPRAGRFLVQLDSDDVYASHHALQIIVELIASGPWAMAVGAYRTVDMAGAEMPPGVVAHREWTDENGHNNLLRVSGVGAPRAFATGFVRANPFPDTSYGEDYAMALSVSRRFHIARTFDVLYLARRWEGNTDHAAASSVARAREAYKNRLRTVEVLTRALGANP